MPRRDSIAIIEPLTGDDLVAIAQCHALDATVFPHVSLPRISGPATRPNVLVARDDEGRVVGFAAMTCPHVRIMELRGLAVDPARHRQGIGRALVRAVVREARTRNIKSLLLHVSTTNSGAIALYESEGFAALKRVPAYYKGASFGEQGDAWVMVRTMRRKTTTPR